MIEIESLEKMVFLWATLISGICIWIRFELSDV